MGSDPFARHRLPEPIVETTTIEPTPTIEPAKPKPVESKPAVATRASNPFEIRKHLYYK